MVLTLSCYRTSPFDIYPWFIACLLSNSVRLLFKMECYSSHACSLLHRILRYLDTANALLKMRHVLFILGWYVFHLIISTHLNIMLFVIFIPLIVLAVQIRIVVLIGVAVGILAIGVQCSDEEARDRMILSGSMIVVTVDGKALVAFVSDQRTLSSKQLCGVIYLTSTSSQGNF